MSKTALSTPPTRFNTQICEGWASIMAGGSKRFRTTPIRRRRLSSAQRFLTDAVLITAPEGPERTRSPIPRLMPETSHADNRRRMPSTQGQQCGQNREVVDKYCRCPSPPGPTPQDRQDETAHPLGDQPHRRQPIQLTNGPPRARTDKNQSRSQSGVNPNRSDDIQCSSQPCQLLPKGLIAL